MRDSTREFAKWLEAGGSRIGQVAITRIADGWELRHVHDAGRGDLALVERATVAREVANLDDAGNFRPLKTAPTLRRGWRLVAGNAGEVRKAIEGFYPAMIAMWFAHCAGEVRAVELRETLGRQTGMYRVTQKLTDAEAQEVIAHTCNDGFCLKTILWRIDRGQEITSLPGEKFAVPSAEDVMHGRAMPMLCQEACNILVAAARKKLKGETE